MDDDNAKMVIIQKLPDNVIKIHVEDGNLQGIIDLLYRSLECKDYTMFKVNAFDSDNCLNKYTDSVFVRGSGGVFKIYSNLSEDVVQDTIVSGIIKLEEKLLKLFNEEIDNKKSIMVNCDKNTPLQ